MELSGLHLLLTYQCTLECDHCFVWGSPWQSGTMSLGDVRRILDQAEELGTIRWIYFEGGEPFLYYAVLLAAAREATERGFEVGVVSNGYWATDLEDARMALAPFAGLLKYLSVSSDDYHGREETETQLGHIRTVADELGIPCGGIRIAQPASEDGEAGVGQLPEGESGVMYRGRAARTLASKAVGRPWHTFAECPYENLRDPGRVHVDPLGNLHLCQGISMGNLFDKPLHEILAEYDPDADPIVGPLLDGGPAALVQRYSMDVEGVYADACHLCDTARRSLRGRFPEVLGPDQQYGVPGVDPEG